MKHINLIISAAIVFLIGVTAGYSAGILRACRNSFPEILEVADTNPHLATIKLMEYSGGNLTGTVDGRPVRIAYSPDHILSLEPGQNFEIPVSRITLASYYDAQNLPENAQFIASQQGKYYYHVLDARAFKITPKNRLYFSNRSQAEEDGFLPSG